MFWSGISEKSRSRTQTPSGRYRLSHGKLTDKPGPGGLRPRPWMPRKFWVEFPKS